VLRVGENLQHLHGSGQSLAAKKNKRKKLHALTRKLKKYLIEKPPDFIPGVHIHNKFKSENY
jgi:hypothetical protein